MVYQRIEHKWKIELKRWAIIKWCLRVIRELLIWNQIDSIEIENYRPIEESIFLRATFWLQKSLENFRKKELRLKLIEELWKV